MSKHVSRRPEQSEACYAEASTYSTDDLVMVGEVRFAVLAAVDALGVEVDVVGEAHLVGTGDDGRPADGDVGQPRPDVIPIARCAVCTKTL